MTHIIHYAHCVKFTAGELDQHPYSRYESREVSVELEKVTFPNNPPEYLVHYCGAIIANEDTQADALAIATYDLMVTSRTLAEFEAVKLEQALGNPKFTQKTRELLGEL